jgi:hypothetical protein
MASTRRIRSGSAECQDTVDQSTSETTSRPPGRRARCSSARAAAGSETYSSTCTDSALSKLASATGSAVASALLEQLGDVEARPAADVKDPLAGGGPQSLADQPPPAQHVTGAVQGLELVGEVVVEDQLAHREALLVVRVGRWQLACAYRPVAQHKARWGGP